MNMDRTTIDDELLSAWVDGELDGQPEQREQVEAWLREHPQDAARVRLWAADRDGLRERLAPGFDAPVPPRLRALVLGPPLAQARRWLQAAMAAALLLAGGAIGALLGRQWPASESATPMVTTNGNGWVQRAAYAHGVYVPEPRHAVEVKAQEEHLARWLTRRIDVPVKLFDLREFGFELVGGRLLPDGPGKSAQLMYQDAQGTRITVYLRKPDEGTDAAFRYERQGDAGPVLLGRVRRAATRWSARCRRNNLLALAQSIYRQHPVAAAPGASAPSK